MEENIEKEYLINGKTYKISKNLIFAQIDQLKQIDITNLKVIETDLKDQDGEILKNEDGKNKKGYYATNYENIDFCRIAAIALYEVNQKLQDKNVEALEKELKYMDADVVCEIVQSFMSQKKIIETIAIKMNFTGVSITIAMKNQLLGQK